MAKKVREMPEGKRREGKYPWDEWLDGSVWELEPGSDFKVELDSMRSLAISAAKRQGGKLKTRVTGGKLYIQYSKT